MDGDTIASSRTVSAARYTSPGLQRREGLAIDVALHRPDLVRRCASRRGCSTPRRWWRRGVLDGEPQDFLDAATEKLSPTNRHYGVIVAKLAAMHAREPVVTTADLREVPAARSSWCRTRRRGPLGDAI